MTLLSFLILCSVTLASIVLVYFLLGVIALLAYSPQQADNSAENVVFVIVTIGDESVATTLWETINHQLRQFPNCELHVVSDEGCDLETELRADDRFTATIVPTDYETEATAKGRAVQYFIESAVDASGDTWYAFIDDDNRVRSRDLLYEIPYYEQRGYRAANAILYPRQGKSALAFIVDHLRTVEDLTSFRFFTGLLKTPLMGFHGELLTVRGDTLTEIGFDRASLVEDYAVAKELVRENVDTWQTASGVSILSPHSLTDLFKQRRRWYIGLLQEQTIRPLKMTGVMGVRLIPWTFGLIGGITVAPLWLLSTAGVISTLQLPLMLSLGLGLLAITHLSAGVIGALRLDQSVWRRLGHTLLVPVYFAIELFAVPYAILTHQRAKGFEVIEK